ncbi:nucleotidyltransferase domain-containing protein [Thermococcus prieurii]
MNVEDKVFELAKEHFGKNLMCVLLFGSRARGTARDDSDYDFLIITKKKAESSKFWKEVFLFETKTGVSIDVIVVDEGSLKPTNPLLWGVLTGYRVLYGEKEWKRLLSKLKRKIKELKPKLVEGASSWEIAQLI